jgi:hypothetical protein
MKLARVLAGLLAGLVGLAVGGLAGCTDSYAVSLGAHEELSLDASVERDATDAAGNRDGRDDEDDEDEEEEEEDDDDEGLPVDP